MTNVSNMERQNRELIVEFCAQADVAALTKKQYRAHLEEFRSWLEHPRSRPTCVSRDVCAVATADVVRFMAYLTGGDRYAVAAHACRRGVLSASSRKSFLASLRSLYRYLVSVSLVTSDPTEGVKRPKVHTTPGVRLTTEEVRRLLDAPGSPRVRVQAYLLAFTAARMNELRMLRWRDVDINERTIMLQGKNNKYRVIDIHPELMPQLRRWAMQQSVDADRNPQIKLAKANPDTDFVLLTRRGQMIPRSTMSKQLKQLAVRAGIYPLESKHGAYRSQVSPHALRRTFATILLNDGHHIDAVADVLGHHSVDTTRTHYAFSSTARRRATIQAFNV
jgi:integrase/recombinase XerD